MQYRKPEGPVVEEIRNVLDPRGFDLVAFSAEIIRKRMHVHCVLHHRDGVNLDALAEVHRELQPRIEGALEEGDSSREIRIEFSSPGLSRAFSSFHEFEIFLGRSVALLPIDASEWLRGTIVSADRDQCLVRLDGGGESGFRRESIVKARLTE